MNLYEVVIQGHNNYGNMFMDACICKNIGHDSYGSSFLKISGIATNQVKKWQAGPYYKGA